MVAQSYIVLCRNVQINLVGLYQRPQLLYRQLRKTLLYRHWKTTFQCSVQGGSIWVQEDQENWALYHWVLSIPTFFQNLQKEKSQLKKKKTKPVTFPANSTSYHHYSVSHFPLQPSSLLKLPLSIRLWVLITSDTPEKKKKKWKKAMLQDMTVKRNRLCYAYIPENSILRVSIPKLLLELQWLRPQISIMFSVSSYA